jgi:hypothetical protein
MTPRGAGPSAAVDVDVAVVGTTPPGCGNYRRECEEIVGRGYEGFVLGRER